MIWFQYHHKRTGIFLLFWGNLTLIALGFVVQYYLEEITQLTTLSPFLNIPLVGSAMIPATLPWFSKCTFEKAWKNFPLFPGISIATASVIWIATPWSRTWIGITDIMINSITIITITFFVIIPIFRNKPFRNPRNRKFTIIYTCLFIPIMALFIIKDFYHFNFLPEQMRAFPLFYFLISVIMMIHTPFKQQSEGLPDIIPPEKLKALGLTSREGEIALLLARGVSYKEIANRCYISLNTVQTHVRRIYEKTGATSKWDLNKILK